MNSIEVSKSKEFEGKILTLNKEVIISTNYPLKESKEPDYIKIFDIKLLKKIAFVNTKLSHNNLPMVDIEVVEKALRWCKKWHKGQFRKSGEPFYTHPVQVAIYCLYQMPQTHIIVSALLHDVVEDTNCTTKMVRQEFGARVAEIVHLLTRIRNEEKISVPTVLEEAIALGDNEVLFIKAMDRAHNMETISAMKLHKQAKAKKETNDYIAPSEIYCTNFVLKKQ
jgi:(p)ppGpp synthase/HD superfamily hydrolase